jgi:IS605 OrfB family transposase
VRKVAHGVAWFAAPDAARVLELMRLQCSATRSAYQAGHKHGLKANAVVNYVKRNYMGKLNQRYISDAASLAGRVVQDKVVFGGRSSWREVSTGALTKAEWQQRRNSQLYSRGDRTKSGNPNIRIVGSELWVNDPAARGKWIVGKLFIPSRWKVDLVCYESRLLFRQGRFEARFSWETDAPAPMQTVSGAVGVDCNPDGVAVVEVDGNGNLCSHHYEQAQRIQFAGHHKRDNDIRTLAVAVVSAAKAVRKPLVLERLRFTAESKASGHRKFRRMKHNFIYRRMLAAITARAIREGVPVIEVNPAFTSILGNLKYTDMYSLNRHTAAALVIARRGMGLREHQTFTVTPERSHRENLNLEGRRFSCTVTAKAYSYLQDGFLRMKPAGLTASVLAPGLEPGIGTSAGATPAGESGSTTGRPGYCNNVSGDERLPSECGIFHIL